MKIKIEKKEEKPLVEREEIFLKIIDAAITPSKDQVREELAKLIGKPKEEIVVKKISQKFGEQDKFAIVYVYNSEEALKKFEPKKKEKKAEAQADKKKEETKE